MRSSFDFTIIDAINNAIKTVKAAPLMLGGVAGSGGGIGGPVGGFVGYLPQTRVSYDLSEDETLYTPLSGMSLLDNLNHIRYRIGVIESGGVGSTTFLDLTDTPSTYTGQIGKMVVVNSTETGVEFVTPSGGSIGPFTANRILYTTISGEVAVHDNLEYDQQGEIISLGRDSGSEASHVFSWATGGVSFHNIASWGASIYSSIRGISAGGTKASPTAIPISGIVMRYRGSAYDGAGLVLNSATGAELRFVADENQSSTNHGMRAEIWTTPSGSTTETKALTIGSDGSLKNGNDSAYENMENKDVSDGYVGKTLEKINFWNTARTFMSFLTNVNTAARTYTFKNRDGQILDDSDYSDLVAQIEQLRTRWIPWGVFTAISPLAVNENPYTAVIDRTIIFKKLTHAFYVATTNDASNYWTINVYIQTGGVLVKALNTSTSSPNAWTQLTTTTFDVASAGTAGIMLYVSCIKTGTPGNLYIAGPMLEVE